MIQNITSENTENNQNEVKDFEMYGGFWRRLAAYVLDLWPTFIALIIFFSIFIGIEILENETKNLENENKILEGVNEIEILETINEPDNFIDILSFSLIILILISLINIGYNIYLYYTRGTTIGYEILGMRIISEETGEKSSGWLMTKRWIVKSIASSIFYIVIIYLYLWSVSFLNIISYMETIHLLLLLLFIIFCIAIVLLLVIGFMIILSKKKQGPHDRIAGTLVVINKIKRKWIVWTINSFLIFILVSILISVIVFMILVWMSVIHIDL